MRGQGRKSNAVKAPEKQLHRGNVSGLGLDAENGPLGGGDFKKRHSGRSDEEVGQE